MATSERQAATSLARFGFAAKGALYATIGVLSARLALGSGGASPSQQGALDAISRQPFGRAALGLVALGLAAYAAYRFLRMVRGPEQDGAMPEWLERVSDLVRGVIYTGLAVLAVREATSGASSGSTGSTAGVTARVLGWPGGAWLVGAVGAVVLGVGAYQLYKAWTVDWDDELEHYRMTSRQARWTRRVGVVGHIGRGIAYLLVGGFVALAALQHDPQKGGGLDVALREVQDTTYGPFVLAAVAVGFVAYGLFCAVLSRYRRED